MCSDKISLQLGMEYIYPFLNYATWFLLSEVMMPNVVWRAGTPEYGMKGAAPLSSYIRSSL